MDMCLVSGGHCFLATPTSYLGSGDGRNRTGSRFSYLRGSAIATVAVISGVSAVGTPGTEFNYRGTPARA